VLHYPSNPKPSFNPKREARKETPKPREEAFICMFYGRAGHLDEFCFRWKRIERRYLEYARDSYRDDLFDVPPQSYSRTPSRFTLVLRLAPSHVLCLAPSHVFCLALFLVLCLSSLMDSTIAHIVLVHERTVLSLDALDTAHVLIVVIVSRVGLVFPLEGPFPTLS
jgi:hypothetical protein